VDIPLTGNAPAPVITVQGCPVDFGTLAFPADATRFISVCNTGGCTLKLTGVAFTVGSSPAFSILEPSPTPGAPLNIAQGDCILFHVLFHPTAAGTFNGSIHFDSNAPLALLDCPVTGTAVAGGVADVDATPLCFDPTVVQRHGTCESTEQPTITNVGSSPVLITSVFINGPNADAFHLHGNPDGPVLLQPGHVLGDGDLVVDFQPNILGPNQATLHVVIGGPTPGEVQVLLAGEGVRPGSRLLVLFSAGGTINPPIPFPLVKEIDLQRQQGNGGFTTISVQKKVIPKTIPANGPCPEKVFHVERGTLTSQLQFPDNLRPGVYRWKVIVHIGGKDQVRYRSFQIGNCDFRELQTII